MSAAAKCTVCGAGKISSIVEIDGVPVCCNQLCRTREAAVGVTTGKIALAYCSGCGHIFNREFDPRLLEYAFGYENSLHGSPTFQSYADGLIDELIDRYQLRGRTVVEIGCGRGEFLRALCRRGGSRGIGFDPSYAEDGRDWPADPEFSIRRESFGAGANIPAADLIYSRHTLEHLASPREFLESIRVAAGGVGTPVFCEVPNGLFTVRDGGIWDIIYEHCSYFTSPSLTRVFIEAGYRVAQVAEVFGGQFLALHARMAETVRSGCLLSDMELEPLVASFADSFAAKIESWKDRLDGMAREGRRPVVWGAGSKGTTFLNLLKPLQIEYVVDVNSRKHGNFIAGTGQQIVGPEFLKSYRPDAVICMNPNYSTEIARQVEAMGIHADLIQV
jgi:SAM-dependent methyltransferase